MPFVDPPWIDSFGVDPSNSRLTWCVVAAGVPPDVVRSRIISSPALTLTSWVRSVSTVSASLIVTVSADATPLTSSVYVAESPTPGAVATRTFRLRRIPDAETGQVQSFCAADHTRPQRGLAYRVALVLSEDHSDQQ